MQHNVISPRRGEFCMHPPCCCQPPKGMSLVMQAAQQLPPTNQGICMQDGTRVPSSLSVTPLCNTKMPANLSALHTSCARTNARTTMPRWHARTTRSPSGSTKLTRCAIRRDERATCRTGVAEENQVDLPMHCDCKHDQGIRKKNANNKNDIP